MEQIDQAIYPKKKERADKLSGHITPKKLRTVTQKKLATVLGVTPGRINQIIAAEPKKYTVLRRYIREAGRRDAVLLLLQTAKTRGSRDQV